MDRAKPFCIAKREVWEAYKQVKANQGAAGVDGQIDRGLREDLSNNLYKIWNRMSSGSYFPPPVRRVDIPKGDTGRNAAARDSDGRRPHRPDGGQTAPGADPGTGVSPGLLWISAREVGARRPRQGPAAMLAHDWVLDLDIKSFFDEIDWDLLMRAVRRAHGLPMGSALH